MFSSISWMEGLPISAALLVIMPLPETAEIIVSVRITVTVNIVKFSSNHCLGFQSCLKVLQSIIKCKRGMVGKGSEFHNRWKMQERQMNQISSKISLLVE